MVNRQETLDVGQLGVQLQDDLLPVCSLLVPGLGDTARGGGRWRGSVLQYNLGPTLEDVVGDVELPVDGQQESDLVLVDLVGVETRDLAPGASRVVSVLEILGGQDQSGEEHATTALQGAAGLAIVGLLHGEVVLRHMRLD